MPASTSARWTASPSPQRRGGRPAPAPEGAGAEPDQDLYVSGPLKTGPGDGQGRGRLPALRPVRRALPDRRLGHAEVPADITTQGRPGCRTGQRSAAHERRPRHEARNRRARQRLRHQVRQRQRLGLGLGQRTVRQGDPAHGRAGQPAQHLPQQHPGPADLVRGARLRAPAGWAGAAVSTDGGDEPADLGRRRGRDRARRLPVLRQHQAAAAIVAFRDDITSSACR
jgi:hypothetical protein